MGKKMQEIEVYVAENNDIIIKQPRPMKEAVAISVNPLQVDLLVEWLKEAKGEALGKKK
jgi:hypothetical protein